MKQLKRITALTLVFLQLFLLCGCSALEEMRQNQAFFGDGTDISWNGTTYKLLPSCEYLSPELDYETTIWVTTTDVPVLLSTVLSGRMLTPSKDGAILEPMYETGFFCREDMYQQLSQRIQEGFTPEVVCYSYELYDEETWEYTEQTYILTDEQVEVIELVTSTVEPDTMGEGWWLDYDWSVMLEECSADMLFRRSELEIARSDRTYYLLLYTDTETLAFTVPDGCNALFDQITEDYITAWESYWDTEEDYI